MNNLEQETPYIRVENNWSGLRLIDRPRAKPKPERELEWLEELIGKPISPEQLIKLYGQRGRLMIQTYANQLHALDWHKFAISKTEHRFSSSPPLRFFEIGKLQEGEKGVKIIYLGTGKTDKIPKIGNEIAADSWGFAVLAFAKRENISKKGLKSLNL